MGDGRTAALLGVVAVAAILTGCSSTSSGSPVPGTITGGTRTDPGRSSQSSAPGPVGPSGAPKVESPLDATPYLAQPCAAISPRLRESLKVPGEGEPRTTGELGKQAPACRWSSLNIDGEAVGVSFLKGNENGLADLYRQHEDFNDFKYWEETTVEGHPGVFHGLQDRRNAGQCSLAVGLNDALAMSVDEEGRLGPRSCERARSVAAAVIRTMRGQG